MTIRFSSPGIVECPIRSPKTFVNRSACDAKNSQVISATGNPVVFQTAQHIGHYGIQNFRADRDETACSFGILRVFRHQVQRPRSDLTTVSARGRQTSAKKSGHSWAAFTTPQFDGPQSLNKHARDPFSFVMHKAIASALNGTAIA